MAERLSILKVHKLSVSYSAVTLDRPIPVHMTYFTVVVDENGKVSTFTDLYGFDRKVANALLATPPAFRRRLPTRAARAKRRPTPRRQAPAGRPQAITTLPARSGHFSAISACGAQEINCGAADVDAFDNCILRDAACGACRLAPCAPIR